MPYLVACSPVFFSGFGCCFVLCFRNSGGGRQGQAVATTLLGLLLRLGGPPPSLPSSLSPPLHHPPSSAAAEKTTENTEQSREAQQHQTDGTEQASEVKQQQQQQQPGGSGGDGSVEEERTGGGEHGGWEEFGGDPGRLVADYAARLLSVLVSLSKARSYVLGEVRGSQFWCQTSLKAIKFILADKNACLCSTNCFFWWRTPSTTEGACVCVFVSW